MSINISDGKAKAPKIIEKTIDFSSQYVSIMGRTMKNGDSLVLGWPGSGFYFDFEGAELRIKFGNFDSERHFYFKITIDKLSQTHCVCASGQVIIIRGIGAGIHKAKVTKLSECMQQAEVESITVCGEKAEFYEPDNSPKLKFEFIGDSLTAGFGNMSTAEAGVYRESEQDMSYAFAHLTAESFKADGRYICCSGKGVFNNWDGTKHDLIPVFYERKYITVDEPHDFSSWIPDIIFINAGTNDATANTDPKVFKNAYIDFVNRVHQLNPSSTIVCIHGMTTDKLAGAFEEIKEHFKSLKEDKSSDMKIEFIKFVPITEEYYGALWHPNMKANAKFAREVIKVVKRLLPR